ncbi:MAG: hypothetical protein OZ928_16655 [Polyangiaceae bacterium]|nr:hypothetical protein [Polyangiaceae bacterium]
MPARPAAWVVEWARLGALAFLAVACASAGTRAPSPAESQPGERCVRAARACGDEEACARACESGELEACSSVLAGARALEVSRGSVERARRALVRACGEAPACGCYFLAETPVEGGSEADRVGLFRRSCEAGGVEGCDALYEAELARCNADPPDLRACAAARRVPGGTPNATGAPPAWTGALGQRWFLGCWRRALRHADEPSLYCFDESRYYVWQPRGGWDALEVRFTLEGLSGEWVGHVGGQHELRLEPRSRRDTAWYRGLDVEYGWGELSRSWGRPGALERLPPARTRELQTVLARLPDVARTCQAARRCVAGVGSGAAGAARAGAASAWDSTSVPSLLECRASASRAVASHAWRAGLARARGAAVPELPAECGAALGRAQ